MTPAKKIKGRNRHILRSRSGSLLLVIVHAADIQDRYGTPTCSSGPSSLPKDARYVSLGAGVEIGDAASGLGFNAPISIETVVAETSDDRIFGSNADNTLIGNGGDDLLAGLDGNDLLIGGPGNDALSGGNGDEMINGDGQDNDKLFGDNGDDRLFCGDGVDIFNGCADDDLLLGQQGIDTDVFGTNSGNDTISQYGLDVTGQPRIDEVIDLQALTNGANAVGFTDVFISRSGTSTLITVAGNVGNQIELSSTRPTPSSPMISSSL